MAGLYAHHNPFLLISKDKLAGKVSTNDSSIYAIPQILILALFSPLTPALSLADRDIIK